MQFNPTDAYDPKFFERAIIRTSSHSPTQMKFEVKTRHSNSLIRYLGKVWRWFRHPCTHMSKVWLKMIENGLKTNNCARGRTRLEQLRNLQNNLNNFETKVIQKHNRTTNLFRVGPLSLNLRKSLVTQAEDIMDDWRRMATQHTSDHQIQEMSWSTLFTRFEDLRISYDQAKEIKRANPLIAFRNFDAYRDGIVEKFLQDCSTKMNDVRAWNVGSVEALNAKHAELTEMQARAVVEICSLYGVQSVSQLPQSVLHEINDLNNVEEISYSYSLLRLQNAQLRDTPIENRFQVLTTLPGINILRCSQYGRRCGSTLRYEMNFQLSGRSNNLNSIRIEEQRRIRENPRRRVPPNVNPSPQNDIPPVNEERLSRQVLVAQRQEDLRGALYLAEWTQNDFAEIPNYRQTVTNRRNMSNLLTTLRNISEDVATNRSRETIVARLRPHDGFGILDQGDYDLATMANMLVTGPLTNGIVGLANELNAEVLENLETELAILRVQFSSCEVVAPNAGDQNIIDGEDGWEILPDGLLIEEPDLTAIEPVQININDHEIEVPQTYMDRARLTLANMKREHEDDYDNLLLNVTECADRRWNNRNVAVAWDANEYLPAPFKNFCDRLDNIMGFLSEDDESHPADSQEYLWRSENRSAVSADLLTNTQRLMQDAAYLMALAEDIMQIDDSVIDASAKQRYKDGLELIAKGYLTGFNPQTTCAVNYERVNAGFIRTNNIPQRHYFEDESVVQRPGAAVGTLWNPMTTEPLQENQIEPVPQKLIALAAEFIRLFPGR